MIPKGTVRVADAVWEIPRSYKPGMRVPARLYATEALLARMDDGVFEQLTNVATLPGIVRHACCMPDGHWGYGFPIGGVAAFDEQDGGDLPRGHRLRHQLRHAPGAHRPHPGGGAAPAARAGGPALRARPGRGGRHGFLHLSRDEFRTLAEEGAPWCVRARLRLAGGPGAHRGGGRVRGADARR